MSSVKEMMLDLLVDKNQEISMGFTKLFSKVNFIHVDPEHHLETQVSQIAHRKHDICVKNYIRSKLKNFTRKKYIYPIKRSR